MMKPSMGLRVPAAKALPKLTPRLVRTNAASPIKVQLGRSAQFRNVARTQMEPSELKPRTQPVQPACSSD